ncbi:hypothetical protein Bbelb_124270 [Branchiostoma belcheri]|nr:hypothetical protein Bbelb_124270 [Branchiostoma belcheri]
MSEMKGQFVLGAYQGQGIIWSSPGAGIRSSIPFSIPNWSKLSEVDDKALSGLVVAIGRAVLEVQRTQQEQIATLCRLFVSSLNGLRERLASNHSSSRYRGPRSPRTHPCFLCNRLGHWKRQCPLRYSPGHKGPNNHPPSLPIRSDYDTPALADATTTHSGSGPVTPHGLRSAGPFSSSFPASPNSDSRGTPVLTPVAPVLPSAPATDVHVPPPVSVLLPTPGAARAESPVTPPVPVPRTSVTPPVPVPRTSVTLPVPVPRTSGAETPVTPPVPVLPTTSTTVPTTSPRRRPSRRQNRPEHMNTSISIPDYVPLSYSDSETDHLHPNVCQDCSQDEGLTGQGPPSDRPGPRGESLEVDPSPPPLRELGSGVASFFSSMGPVVPSERWALLVPSPSCSHGTPAKHGGLPSKNALTVSTGALTVSPRRCAYSFRRKCFLLPPDLPRGPPPADGSLISSAQMFDTHPDGM